MVNETDIHNIHNSWVNYESEFIYFMLYELNFEPAHVKCDLVTAQCVSTDLQNYAKICSAVSILRFCFC